MPIACPRCQSDLTFIGSWTFRGLWGYNEVRTFECPEHGPIFIGAQEPSGYVLDRRPNKAPEEGDRDSLISAPRRPKPTLDADTIVVCEAVTAYGDRASMESEGIVQLRSQTDTY